MGERGKSLIISFTILILMTIALFITFFLLKPDSRKNDGYKYVIGVSYSESYSAAGRAFQNDIKKNISNYQDVNVLLLDCGNDSQKRKEDINSLIKQKVDLIIISSTNSSSETEIFKVVQDAKIPFIVLSDSMTDVNCTLTIKTDYKEMGRQVGKYIQGFAKGYAKAHMLEIFNNPGSMQDTQIQEGFREVIRESGSVSVDYVMAGYDSYNVTIDRITESELIKPSMSFDFVFAHSDSMAIAVSYLFKIYKPNKSVIIGIGARYGAGGGLEAVSRGKISATIYSSSGGQEALEFALKVLKGESVPKTYTLPVELVTLENVKSFEGRFQQ